MERPLATLLLAVMLAGVASFLRGDRAEWRRFASLTDTRDRQRRYRRWIARLWRFFALPPLVGLALLGRPGALLALPVELRPAADLLPRFDDAPRDLLIGLGSGVAIGVAVVAIVTRLRGGRAPRPLGDIAAILPRNRAELWLAAGLSISAGVTEEMTFRLFLPMLIAIVTGSATIGAAIAVVLFAAMHLYQGWAGVLATGIVGAVLTFAYLASGALWLAIMLHAAVDLGGMVLRPALAGVGRR